MKKIITSLAIFSGLLANLKAQTALPILNMESGNRNTEQANCWSFNNVAYSNLEFRIAGFWSGRTPQLTNSSITNAYIKSPWVAIGSGNITLKTRLENASGTTRAVVFSYIPYDAGSSNANKEGTSTIFYTYNFAAPFDIWIKNLSVPIPSAIANSSKPYKIMISFIGTGGSSRAFVDDVLIPCNYNSNPANSCLPLVTISDSDKDGVEDQLDAYPEDSERAYNTHLVQEATLMFEDLWPNTGDYDFNDLVAKYNAVAVTNASNAVVEVLLDVQLRAIGASFNNGLAFQFDKLDPSKIKSVKGNDIEKTKWVSLSENGTEAEQKYANIIVFAESQKVLQSSGGSGVNVIQENPYVKPQTIKVIITFDPSKENSISTKELMLNPYIIVNQERGVEVHLADHMPSSKASEKLFGTGKDRTSLEKENYYKTENNLPFAIQLEKEAPHMLEKNDLLLGYPKFADWIKSDGKEYTDWYSNSEYRNAKYLYNMKD